MSEINREIIHSYFENLAGKRDRWLKRNRFYHKTLVRHYSLIIPEGARVIELGCGTGDLLSAVKPSVGVGIDFSGNMIAKARGRHAHLTFHTADASDFHTDIKFDYVIMSDLLSSLWDIQQVIRNLSGFIHPRTKIIISSYNYVWEPVLRLGEFLHLKARQPLQSWLTIKDIQGLLELEGFEVVKVDRKLWIPKYIPIINLLFNSFLANLPGLNSLCLVNLITARPVTRPDQDFSVSVVVPARNEMGNIENAVLRTPVFGSRQEFIFIEGHSADQTYEEMLRVQAAYPDRNIRVMKQSGRGKGNAVREAFEAASGEILMILDADLTTPPEDMPKFYQALASNRGEFINGCRLVYPMEKEAMRFLNYLANKFFGWFFSYLLGQRMKDTLCGTKVLFRQDYELIKANRKFFGEFDPFGDFDLLFGAARLNLKITEVIVRYRDREYGSTQISRFRHGMLLIRMSLFAARKIKFRA
ncbi:MAG: glycosyl transferase [Bacteroidetes bacterium GWF2_49_14]|nr:MAG: glycosyl transferase [Bacteroidetes bacterium GWF2_49_14]HBB92300.1 glycosyl transferase [Bacteroidales bacterium]